MNFDKTYKDFVNDIVTEAKVGVLKDNPNSFGKTFVKDAVNDGKKVVNKVAENLKKRREAKEKLLQEMTTLLPLYGKAFIIVYNDPKYWNDFIASLKKQSKNGKITKFQFVSYFFKYYMAKIMKNSTGDIYKTLKQAAQSLEMTKDQYKKSKIRYVKKFVNNADKHKDVFVKIFKSLTRDW